MQSLATFDSSLTSMVKRILLRFQSLPVWHRQLMMFCLTQTDAFRFAIIRSISPCPMGFFTFWFSVRSSESVVQSCTRCTFFFPFFLWRGSVHLSYLCLDPPLLRSTHVHWLQPSGGDMLHVKSSRKITQVKHRRAELVPRWVGAGNTQCGKLHLKHETHGEVETTCRQSGLSHSHHENTPELIATKCDWSLEL